MSIVDFFSHTAEGLFFECDSRRSWRFEHFGLKGEEGLIEMPEGSLSTSPISYWFLPADPNDNAPVHGTVLQGRITWGFIYPKFHGSFLQVITW